MTRNADDVQGASKMDCKPLRAMASTGVSHVLRQPNADLLIIAPVIGFQIIGISVGAFLCIVAGVLIFSSGQLAGLLPGAIGGLFVVVFVTLIFVQRRFRFDRQRGELTIHRCGSTRRFPFSQVRAVQLIPGMWFVPANAARFFTWQTNLVLDNADLPRINLTNTANWDATWQIAERASAFLGVPFVDIASQESSPVKS